MDKKHFFLKLIGYRPTFPQDISEDEKKIMLLHRDYWMDFMRKGILLIYGPVSDPKATFGMGVVEVDSLEEINSLIEKDPAVTNKLGFYEIYPMRAIYPGNLPYIQ